LLGAGGIAGMIADALNAGNIPGVQCVAVAGSTQTSESAAALAERLNARAVAPDDLQHTSADWILEAAGIKAVQEYIPGLWAAGRNTIIMSIGAFADADLWSARTPTAQVILPSGGIAGLDGVKALAATKDLQTARITTTKHPTGLQGAPFLLENNISLPLDKPVHVFTGNAREAVAGFPANVNVTIALSLAGNGPDHTQVTVHSDPAATRNRHLIEAEGNLASIKVEITSEPNPTNPRTSFMAGASAIAALTEVAGIL